MKVFSQLEFEFNEYYGDDRDDVSAAGLQSEAVLASFYTLKNSPAVVPPSPAGDEALDTPLSGEKH